MRAVCLFLYVNKYGSTNLTDMEEHRGFRLNFSKTIQPVLRHVMAGSFLSHPEVPCLMSMVVYFLILAVKF